MSKNTATATANTDATTAEDAVDTPAHLANDNRHKDLLKQVRSLGTDGAAGQDSLPKLAHAVVKAAADGVIDLEVKNKDGHDQATIIYDAYTKAFSSKAIHEHKDGGKKANVSKLRQLIKMGLMGTIDPVAVMQSAHEVREGLKHDEGTKLKPAYHFYVDLAREQLAKDKPLSQSALEKLAVKGEGDPKEVIDRLKQVQKLLHGLVSGENKDKLKDQDPLTIAAQEAIDERIKAFEVAQWMAETRAKAKAMGITLG